MSDSRLNEIKAALKSIKKQVDLQAGERQSQATPTEKTRAENDRQWRDVTVLAFRKAVNDLNADLADDGASLRPAFKGAGNGITAGEVHFTGPAVRVRMRVEVTAGGIVYVGSPLAKGPTVERFSIAEATDEKWREVFLNIIHRAMNLGR